MKSFVGAALVVAVALVAGCGSPGPATGKVIGSVEFKQQPVAEGQVNFHSNEMGVGATAKIKEGKFAFEAPLEVGTYAVYVAPLPPEPRDPALGPAPAPPPSLIPAKAQDPTTSGLTATVVAGDNDVHLELKE